MRGFLSKIAKRWLPPETMGALDFYRKGAKLDFGVLNNQSARRALCETLLSQFKPAAIVETGTYLGTTTEFFATHCEGLVFSIEADLRAFGFSRARLRRYPNVRLIKGDSRTALRSLFDGALSHMRGLNIFFYLDAHWQDDLPLAAEIDIVFRRCPAAIVMVDDFQVPFFHEYQYDDYGQGKALTPEYIRPNVAAHGLRTFYPSTDPSIETGFRRGCVVLCKGDIHGDSLAKIGLLRETSTGSCSEGHTAQ